MAFVSWHNLNLFHQAASMELAEELCYLARLGFKKKLSCFKLAGANLNSASLTKQTALHAAVETGQIKGKFIL